MCTFNNTTASRSDARFCLLSIMLRCSEENLVSMASFHGGVDRERGVDQSMFSSFEIFDERSKQATP